MPTPSDVPGDEHAPIDASSRDLLRGGGSDERRERLLGEKRINNILAVLSKPLKYAEDCGVIVKAPKVGIFKVERPEIVAWAPGCRTATQIGDSNDETMLYVHVAENHRRDTPDCILDAANGEHDPDRRVLAMIGARGSVVAAAVIASRKSAAATAV